MIDCSFFLCEARASTIGQSLGLGIAAGSRRDWYLVAVFVHQWEANLVCCNFLLERLRTGAWLTLNCNVMAPATILFGQLQQFAKEQVV
mmetsp:Transcript_9510/g.22403  ORF Transcript_9510/g.22403 Transcript_9510/m.22403 type:complete len:89 (-) Transcript_9510:1574-1840(-)